MNIKHYFSSGMYIKETEFKPGEQGTKHVHDYDHFSVLSRGKATLYVDGVGSIVKAPLVLTIKAGKTHQVHAITDVTWLCCHATDCTDETHIDTVLTREA